MSNSPQQPRLDADAEVAPAPPEPQAQVEVRDAQSEGEQPEEVAASPTPQAPAAFTALKAYCEAHSLKSSIELDPPVVCIEFKNGRNIRTVYVGDEEDAEKLLTCSLENVVFLGDYSAICSYQDRWIEAAIRSHGAGGSIFLARRSIFGASVATSTPAPENLAEVEIQGPPGLTLRLTERPGILARLDAAARIYLRIEGIGITEHDKAVALLEDLSNSLFMQIDFRFDVPLTIARDRSLPRKLLKRRGRLDEDSTLIYPRFSYEKSPSALYWYGRSASSMPLLQFLAFYQSIEFSFLHYSRLETVAKIKNLLKSPTFDGSKDSDISVILNILEGKKGSLLEERKQLVATLKHCIDPSELLDFLNETEERKRYYASDYKKVSDKKINTNDAQSIVEQTAERIYDLRCKVVHTKNMEGIESEEMILPFSKEADIMAVDVDLVKFLARKVLIASSAPLKI